jgi:flagellar basal-body rod modification protein FlgD
MSSSISPLSSLSQSGSQADAAVSTIPPTSLANESTFLTLLVTQLQNQDPLNPADSTQFVTQLAQFSQLEDLQNINQNVIDIVNTLTPAAPATPVAAAALHSPVPSSATAKL